MAKRRRKQRKADGIDQDELRRQDGRELPDREAMSLISGLPSLGGGLIGGLDGSGATPTTGPAPSDPTGAPTHVVPLGDLSSAAAPAPAPDAGTEPDPTNPGNLSTVAPSNEANALNQDSAGAVQGASSSQTTPVNQSS